MSFPRYPKYKDSGVEWLGEVPEHWAPVRMRFVAKVNPSKSELGSVSQSTVVSFFPMESINVTVPPTMAGEKTIADVETGYTYFRDGDVAIAKITPCFENGKRALFQGLINGIGFGTTELIVLRSSPSSTPRFLYWLCASPDFMLPAEGSMYGTGGQKRVSDEFVRNFSLALPRVDEQSAIADFLDVETAKIDALIEEQRRLIELLKEKRQAVISHAVTKGLDPAISRKESGLEYVGEIPKHWTLARLKSDVDFITSGSRGWAEHYSDEGALFLRIGNLTREGIGLDLEDIQYVTVPEGAEGERTRVQPQDLLFSITAYLGSIAVAPDGLPPAYVSQHISLVRLSGVSLLAEWVAFVTISRVGKTYLDLQAYGGTKIQLSLDDVRELPIPVPPISEQKTILAYLKERLARLKLLESTANGQIRLLQERRSALISAAVTGKIDVRNYKPKGSAVAEEMYEPA